MELDVLIPAHNEAGYIGRTVGVLKTLPEISSILVVDDGSTDDTAREAAEAGARVIRLPRNLGKGAAVLTGARCLEAPYLALLDADLGESAAEIARLLQPLRDQRVSMTVALFPRPGRPGGLGMVKKLAAWAIRRCTGFILHEPLSGQRVFRRELLQLLRYPPQGFGLEIALSMDLLGHGYTVLEVETAMGHRERGRDPASILHRARQFTAVLRELWLRRGLLFRGKAYCGK